MGNAPEKKKKRTFSMKLKNFIGVKPIVDKEEEGNPSNMVPRVQSDLPAEFEVGPSNAVPVVDSEPKENKHDSKDKAKGPVQ